MSEHRAVVSWKRQTPTFEYTLYNREHEWKFDNGTRIEASAAPDFLGVAGVDPEEAFVAALSSCHMLTFLALASKKRYTVESYSDEPVGTLDKNAQGKMAMTEIVLTPKVTFSGENIPTKEEIYTLHGKAHEHCFIANSYSGKVIIQE